jgi:protein-tyrosine-phosphatase
MNKKVLFICKGNWFRSQIAEAIYNKLTNSNSAFSVGSYVGAKDEPEDQVLSRLFPTQDFFEVMEENGIDVRNKKTKKLYPEMLDEYDVIVSMTEEPYIPDFLKKSDKVIWWDVTNPKFVNRKIAEDTYEKIEGLVRGLISSI